MKKGLYMQDAKKTKKELIQELIEIRKHVKKLEAKEVPTNKALGSSLNVDSDLQKLFDSLSDFLFVLDEKGQVLYFNLAVKDRLGYSDEELLGKSALLVHPPELQDEAASVLSQLLKGKGDICLIPLLAKDGTQIPIETKVKRGHWKNKKILFGISRDITIRKRIEDELKDEQTFTEIALNTLGDVFFVIDLNGKFLRWNRAMNKRTGYSDNEISLMRPADFFSREDIHRVEEAITIARREGSAGLEATLVTKDGRHIPVEISGSLLKNQHGESIGICGISRDIAERKFAEESLSNLYIRQEALLAAIPDIVMEVDNNKVYTWANQAGKEFFGEDVIGREAAYYFVGKQHIYHIVSPLFSGQEDVISVESWQRRKDGQERLLAWWCRAIKDKSGQVTGALSSARDITDFKRVENALRRSEEKYRLAMESTLDGLWDWDIQSGTLVYSLSWYRILGINRINPTYEEWESRIHPDDKTACWESLQRHLDGLTDYWRNDHRLKADTGEWVWVVGRGKVVERDKEGKPLRMVGTVTDISERKKAEEALKESEEKFRSFVESSSEHIFIIGDNGKYIHSNGKKEFEPAQGRSIIGLNISDVYPQKIAEFYRKQIDHVFLTGEKLDFEYHIDEPSGIHYYIDTLFPIKHDKIIYAVGGISRDITDISKIANENEVLSSISHLFLKRESLADIYSELPGILSQKLDFPIVTIERYDIETSEMVLAGSVGLHGLEKTRLRVPVNQAISGKVVLTGKPIDDLNIVELSEYQSALFRELNIETFLCVPIVIKNKVFGTLSLADARKRTRVQSYVNTLQVIANHLSQELERLEALEALGRAKDEWEHTFDAVPDLICILDKEFRIVRINRSMAEKLGKSPAACIGKRCYELLHHNNMPSDSCPHAALLRDGCEHMVETYDESLGGYFVVTVSPIYYKGQLIGGVHMARDITERKKVEDQIKLSLHEKEILLREIHHRVKNNMQIISSLMKLSSESIQDKSILNIFDDSRNRIKSMALIHEKLYRSTDLTRIEFAEYIESLAHELYRAHGVDPKRIRLRLSMESVPLSIDTAIPCGLIVNELITNSIKHAFPEEAEGEISISLSEKESGVVEFTISDNGIGIPASIDLSTAKTLGLYIINILVEDQLEGSITLDRTKGTTFRITFNKKDEKMK